MSVQEFHLTDDQEYIQLNNLLKHLNIAQTGGHAKLLIQNKEVLVNDAAETRIRRKLRSGDTVQVGPQRILIY